MEKVRAKKKWINTLKFFAAYLVAAWTFLQFIDWILNRYNISPYWVDILLWFFIGISPSLLIYLYHQERLSKRMLKLREKIIIPLNAILLIIGLYFGFGNSDLGATTKEINYTDEQGQAQSEIITKEEFRIGIPIFGFDNLTKDKSLDWMQSGIGKLLTEDLFQNKSLSPDFYFYTDTSTKIEESSLFNDFYIDGKYSKENGIYTITAYKRKSTNGQVLKEKVFTGSDFLPLIDQISVFVSENSGFVETKQLRYLDYPINEFMSDSLNAIKEYVNGNYSNAISIDNKFALAYLNYAKKSLRFSRGKLEVQDLTDKAFENRNKLPLQKQLEVYIQRNLAYENFDEAVDQVKLQLEVDPHNDFYNSILFSIYGETKQTDQFLKSSQRLFRMDQNPDTGTNLAQAAMVNGNDDMLIDEIEKYEIISPNLKVFKIQPLLLKGEVDKAEKLLENAKTLYPNYKYRAQVYDSAVKYIKDVGYDISKFKKFEGTYRSGTNEQIQNYWIENNRLIQYVRNQVMDAFVPASNNEAVAGFINNTTYRAEFVLGETNKPIGLRFHVVNWNNTATFWYWKEDSTINKAHEAFDNGNLESAKKYYNIALEDNPNHIYINNYIQHLNYIKEKDSTSLVKQHKEYAGSYGPREFWIENNKFYYKRKSETVDLPKVELLAINANTYMDITRSNTLMLFEKTDSGKLTSNSHSLNIDTWEYEKTGIGENYFERNN